MRRFLVPPLVALSMLAAACGTGSTSDESGNTTTSATPTPTTTRVPVGNEDGVLLQLSYEGGFAPVEFLVNRVPAVTLFTDGTIISEGPTPAIFPGAALPNIQRSAVDEQTMADIIELVGIIGLPDITEVRNNDAANFVADATDTVVRYFDANGEHLFSVYALGIGALPDDPDRPVPDHILNLGLLVDLLTNAAFTGAAEPYQPTELQLVLLENGGFVDPQFANTMSWPFGELSIDDFASNGFLACTTIDGPMAANALSALAGANSVTTYELDGTEHRVLVRPVIPGEPACAMLDR